MSGPASGGRRGKLSSRLRSVDEQLHSILDEIETAEKGPDEQIKLEAVMNRYRYGNKTIRSLHISYRFNEKADIEKFDKATEKGGRYCVVTIRLLPKSSLERQKID